MNDLSKTAASKRDEMIKLWEPWASKNQVAFPKRFNMCECLKSKGKS